VAQHYLVGGDFGPEGTLHSHHYRVELTVAGDSLDGHGFLVDIVRLREELGRLVDRYRDRTLNDLSEFEGLNPGVEVVARAMAQSLVRALAGENLEALTLKLWENDTAWASCRVVHDLNEPGASELLRHPGARSAPGREEGAAPKAMGRGNPAVLPERKARGASRAKSEASNK
jgi:6-pyruvoyltetrahydropterin/6-carboxytetrahydropterin synthase